MAKVITLWIVTCLRVVFAEDYFRCAKDGTTVYIGMPSNAADCKGNFHQNSLDQCSMPINADQNIGIYPKDLSMQIIADHY